LAVAWLSLLLVAKVTRAVSCLVEGAFVVAVLLVWSLAVTELLVDGGRNFSPAGGRLRELYPGDMAGATCLLSFISPSGGPARVIL
jgi:hypothetical protein